MQEREMKYTFKYQKLPREESHPVTNPLGENSRNSAEKQERVKTLIKYKNNKHKMLALYKRWKKHNEVQLRKKWT